MGKYRKKPDIFDAIQWTGTNVLEVYSFIPTGMKGGTIHTEQRSGMSLRDYFAGQALVGIGTWMPVPEVGYPHLMSQETLKQRSEWAYAQADAMIAARKGGEA